MQPIILHHYDASPYSEKVRAMLGYKQLAWSSVTMPAILPKPDLLALTGGYRRAPVLQLGADIFCDSALIVDELERRHPTPPLADGPDAATAALLGHLCDVDLFWRCVRFVMGTRADRIPEALLQDRMAMHPQMDLDRVRLAAALPEVAAQLRPLLVMLDRALAGRDFLGGTRPAAGDFALFHPLWFLRGVKGLDALAPGAEHVARWMTRIAAFGHGAPTALPAVEAIAIAARSAPAPLPDASPDPLLPPGRVARVAPDGYPREAVVGRLRYADTHRVVLTRERDGAGLQIHFPRIGYTVETLAGDDAPRPA
jgi:glutathione S-transferase